jgi:hypothetical protein
MKLRTAVGAAILAALAATGAYAHDEYRIIGTVTVSQPQQLQMKDRQGKAFSMKVDKETLVMRDGKKVDRAEVKAGRFVVVDALGDSLDDLLAVEVRIVPALPK